MEIGAILFLRAKHPNQKKVSDRNQHSLDITKSESLVLMCARQSQTTNLTNVNSNKLQK